MPVSVPGSSHRDGHRTDLDRCDFTHALPNVWIASTECGEEPATETARPTVGRAFWRDKGVGREFVCSAQANGGYAMTTAYVDGV